MTDVERKVWQALRGHRFGGASFRRQAPIGPYIVDFVCHAARLVIELDGGQHAEAAGRSRDAARDRFLEQAGYRVARVWNFEVNAEFEAVMDGLHAILTERGGIPAVSGTAVAATPLPVPPPQGGREPLHSVRAASVPSPRSEGTGMGATPSTDASDLPSTVPARETDR